MIINHNLNATNAHRNMGSVNVSQGKSMEKLSSGMRINRASNDAAGLAISEKMRSQIRGLNQASRNAQDGISMIQTAEGALSETQSISQRMRELAIQSSNGTYTDEDRVLINEEFVQLSKEIDRISEDTEFNGIKLLNGDLSGKSYKLDGTPTVKHGAGGGIDTNGDATAVDSMFGGTTAENLAELGEGTFELKVRIEQTSQYNGLVTVELWDNSPINVYKPYIMDTVKIDGAHATEGFSIGGTGITVDFSNSLEFTTGETTVTFTNKFDKQEDRIKFQIGANQNQTIGFSIDDMGVRELGLAAITVDTQENAESAIHRLDVAIEKISAQRSGLGAVQNRLEHTIASTNNTSENLQAAESRIRDVDMAKEMMNLTKLNVLQQASQSMLAQANQAPQQVLSILK